MCLEIDNEYPKRKKAIRWKVALKSEEKNRFHNIFDMSGVTRLPPHTWRLGKASLAFKQKPHPQAGFHVFVTREDARKFKRDVCFRLPTNVLVILRCEVSQFVAGGRIAESCVGEGMASESWRRMKPLKVVR